MKYWAYVVPPYIRKLMLEHAPFKYQSQRGDHITVSLGEVKPSGWPDQATVTIAGYGDNGKIEAFSVNVDSQQTQPRGIRLHITWSFDPTQASAKDSRDLRFSGNVPFTCKFLAKLQLLDSSN